MKKKGLYIYCIIGASQPLSFGLIGIGGRGDEVYTVCYGALGAVVSDSPVTDYRVSRENTIAHEKAIEQVMKTHTVLPVRFCTIAEDEEKVKKILEKEHDRFIDLLKDMEGKKELGLKAVFFAKGGSDSGGEKDIYNHILEKYDDVRKLKEKIAELPPEKARYQYIKIGKMVEAALEKEKEIHKKHILDCLKPLAVEFKENSTYGERMIINAAFLVNKDKEDEFDQQVRELDKRYGEKIRFKYVGTLPPFNFINLVIETGKY